MDRIVLYAEEVRRFVARRISNLSDAEDIAQQALCVACQKLGTYRHGNLKAWLLTIARHLVVDHYRQQSRFQFVEVESAAVAEGEPALQSGREEVPNLCDSRQRLSCYLRLTDRLPLAEQVAVMLADLLGYRDKDSAAAMGLSLPSFKLLLHHARATLRRVGQGACVWAGLEAACAAGSRACPCALEMEPEAAPQKKAAPQPLLWLPLRTERGRDQNPAVTCSRRPQGSGKCDLGLKCFRLIPRLRVLRKRLLRELSEGLFYGRSGPLTDEVALPESALSQAAQQ